MIDLQYFGSIIYIKNLYSKTYIEIFEYEPYRNCKFLNKNWLLGSNGLQLLSIPIKGGRHTNDILKDVQIDNHESWKRMHWQTIVSFYNRSPFFEFYKNELSYFFHADFIFLLDFIVGIFEWLKGKLQLPIEIKFLSMKKIKIGHFVSIDEKPKMLKEGEKKILPYNQIFEDRIGHYINVSILDLLFCVGEVEARKMLTKS